MATGKKKPTKKTTKPKKKNVKIDQPYIEGNTRYVPIKVKGKTQYLPMAIYPMDDKHISNLEAVKQGVFTAHEMIGVIECYRDDLNLLFHVIDRPGATSEYLIERLINFKNHYLVRWDKLAPEQKPSFHHQYQKLMDFIEGRLWNEQHKLILKEITPVKTAKENKDLLLNQEAMVLLFIYLQKINVFDEKQKLNTNISRAINLLTGWDAEKTRQLLSTYQGFEYSQKPKLKKAIQKLLEELQKIN